MSFKRWARRAERLASTLLELGWQRGFYTIAKVHPPRAMPLRPAGGQRVLVIAPHPDDEAMGCAGSLALHAKSGDTVCVAIATDGRKSRALSDPDRMAAQRRVEAINAADIMQVDRLEWLGLREGDWRVADLSCRLRILIEQLTPDIIYAPSRLDFHPEHFGVAHAAALALADLQPRSDRPPRLRVYQVQVPLTSSVCNLVADVSAVRAVYETALRAYVSQAGSVRCAFRLRRYVARQYGITGVAEGFWEMPAARYIALHRSSVAGWYTAFRGFRRTPICDPLAYLKGQGERARLLAFVAGNAAEV